MPMTLTRSLMTILIPGVVAAAPWFLILIQHTQATLGFDKNPIIANAVLFSAVAVLGSIFEGIGTHIETKWDRDLESEYDVLRRWYRYLNHQSEHEPVAFRYLSRLVTTLYFELSMLIAVPIFIIGACILSALRFPSFICFIVSSGLILLVLSIWYFHMQAKNTHNGICKIRMNIQY